MTRPCFHREPLNGGAALIPRSTCPHATTKMSALPRKEKNPAASRASAGFSRIEFRELSSRGQGGCSRCRNRNTSPQVSLCSVVCCDALPRKTQHPVHRPRDLDYPKRKCVLLIQREMCLLRTPHPPRYFCARLKPENLLLYKDQVKPCYLLLIKSSQIIVDHSTSTQQRPSKKHTRGGAAWRKIYVF